eukprot:3150132-Pleurochrysis_carterae.AAC.4
MGSSGNGNLFTKTVIQWWMYRAALSWWSPTVSAAAKEHDPYMSKRLASASRLHGCIYATSDHRRECRLFKRTRRQRRGQLRRPVPRPA